MIPNDIEPLDWDKMQVSEPADYHAVVSIQLIELVNDGIVDFSSTYWDFDSYDEAQRKRIYEKVQGRFNYREIGILPIRKWHDRFIATLNEIMPKLKPLYKALEDGYSPLNTGSEYSKSRSIFSDFPQTQLGDNQDYASNGTDREGEIIRRGDFIETAQALDERYNDVDVMILNKLDPLFSSLMTVNLNGF